jgi:hypothetical protein
MLNMFRLFLTEGIATVIFGVAIAFLLPDCKDPLFHESFYVRPQY